jgi:hypothetical protein
VKLKVYNIPRRIKKMEESRKGGPRQMETTKAWATQKSAGQGQRRAFSRKKYEVFQIYKRPLDRV